MAKKTSNRDPTLNSYSVPYYCFSDKEGNINHEIREMLNTTITAFEYEGLPDTMLAWVIERNIQSGYPVVVIKHEGKLYATTCGFTGSPDYNYLYHKVIVNNPYIGDNGLNEEYTLGENAVLLRNDPQLVGLVHTYSRYATLLIENDITLRMESINTRYQHLFKAHDDKSKAAADKYMDDLEKGKLASIVTDTFMDTGIKVDQLQLTGNSTTYTQLCEYDRYLRNSLAQYQGLGATTNLKRENVSEKESQQDDDVLLSSFDLMERTRKEDWEEVKRVFGIDVKVNLSSAWKTRREEIDIKMEVGKNDLSDDEGDISGVQDE